MGVKNLNLYDVRSARDNIVLSGGTPEVVQDAIDSSFEALQKEIANGLKVAGNLDSLLGNNGRDIDETGWINADAELLKRTVAKVLKIASRVYRPELRSGDAVGLDNLVPQVTADLYGTREIFAKYDLPFTSRAEAARMNMSIYYTTEELEAFFSSELYQSFFVYHKRFVVIAFATHPLKAIKYLQDVKSTFNKLMDDPNYTNLVSHTDMMKLVFRDSEPGEYLKGMMDFFSNLEDGDKNIFDQAQRLFISHYINGSREKVLLLIADVREVVRSVPPEMSIYITPFLICDQIVSRRLPPNMALERLINGVTKALEQAKFLEALVGHLSLRSIIEPLLRANCMDRNFSIEDFRIELEKAVKEDQISPSVAFHMLIGRYLNHRNP